MSHFKCPNCQQALHKVNKSFVCSNKHSFDCAKSGYVNLLQSQKSSQKQHGDDLLMLKARKDFLDKSYYRSLIDKLNEIINHKESQVILDAGCGEGWYCESLVGNHEVYGIDISKNACDLSAKRNRDQQFAVGSTYDMPLMDECMDVIYSVFAPFAVDEIKRVLKKKGRFIHVFPLEDHLLELKEALYQDVYKNEGLIQSFEGLRVESHDSVNTTIHLDNNQDIQNLFTMTPYVHRTSRQAQENLNSMKTLTTQLSFGITVYTVS